MDFTQFLRWEQSTYDTIDFKKVYVDMVDDLTAGLMLSEIVYWHLPNRRGETKLRVEHDGKLWIACRRYEWWDRTRMSAKQADRSLAVLVDAGLVEKNIFKFDGQVTLHVRLLEEKFLERFDEILANPVVNPCQRGKSILPKGENPNSPKGEIQIPQRVKSILPNRENPITATTAAIPSEITTEVLGTESSAVVADLPVEIETAAAAAPEIQPVQEAVEVKETEPPTVADAPTLTPGSEPPPLPQKAIESWSGAYHQLELQLGLTQFNPLLRDATLNGMETNDSGVEVFVIGVRTLYARDSLQNNFYRAVRRVLTDCYGSPAELRFEVNPPAAVPVNPVGADNPFTPAPPKPATQAEIGAVFTLYTQEIEKALTPLIADDLKDLIQTCGPEAVRYGIDEAARANVRTMRYVVAVAERKAGVRQ